MARRAFTLKNAVVAIAIYPAARGTALCTSASSPPLTLVSGKFFELRENQYVASDANLYAVDISTHLAVDSEAIGGELSVGRHRLIVAPKDRRVTAYVLSK